MSEQNWKTWALVIVGLMGIGFEMLKHYTPQESRSWEKENLTLVEEKPYSISTDGATPVARHRARVGARKAHAVSTAETQILNDQMQKFVAATEPTKTDFDKKPVDSKASAKKAADEWEEVIDPKTGKKVMRKKKKKDEKDKDKKDDKKKEEIAKKADSARPITLTPPPPQPPGPSDDIGGAVDGLIAGAGLPAAILRPTTNSSPFKSLSEWERLLLTRPDLTETKLFISNFQKSLVTPDIFYKIAQMMLDDSRVEMQQLGLLCAGSTPSIASFHLLTKAEKTGRLGAAAHSQLTTLIEQYATLERLAVLQKALTTTDVVAQARAAALVDTAAKKFLNTSTPTPNPSGQGATGNAARFSGFLPILSALSQSGDAGVMAQARTTLSDLQALLGTTAVASTQTR